MADANLNAWWCRLFWEQLVEAGVRQAVLCPGNRNVPLAFAAEGIDDLQVIVHQEERSAAFIALGIANRSGRPTAVCTTSGSAVANCLPALVEAFAVGAPVIMVSADRPDRLHDCEAPQTMRQRGIFTSFVSAEAHLPEPIASTTAASAMRARVGDRLQNVTGPVHLNVPLDDPLPPLPDADFSDPTDPPIWRPSTQVVVEPWQIPDWCRPGLRGTIVAGPRPGCTIAELAELAECTGFPVIADAASGLRSTDIPHLITTADAITAGIIGRQHGDALIRLGPAPIARPVYEWCSRHQGPVLRIDARSVAADFCHDQFDCCPPTALADLCAALADGDQDWTRMWCDAETHARDQRQNWLAEADWSEVIAAAVIADHAARQDLVYLASSMAIRHANLHLASVDRPPRILANRGVNGIDGCIGSFLGALLAEPAAHGLLWRGDLAFLHDLPALVAASQHPLNGTIAVINNAGGAIFDLLPVSKLELQPDLVRTPAPIDIAASARQFGLGHRACFDSDDLIDALAWSRNQSGVQIVEAQVPAESLRDDHPALIKAMT